MDASIRDLKANLSQYIRQVEAGETITVSIHNRPVAKIVPIKQKPSLKDLANTPGILWIGGKPSGLRKGEVMPKGVSLADWVSEDRR